MPGRTLTRSDGPRARRISGHHAACDSLPEDWQDERQEPLDVRTVALIVAIGLAFWAFVGWRIGLALGWWT